MSSPIPENIVDDAAPRLLASMLNWGLYGVLTLQVYYYFISFPKDKRLPKCLVYVIYLLDTVQTFLVTSDVFNAYARHYGDISVLNAMQNEWLAVPVFTSIVSFIVQAYYAHRLRLIAVGAAPVSLIICAIAITQCVAGIVTGVIALQDSADFADLQQREGKSLPVWLAGSAACDVLIAICMVHQLVKRDSKIPDTHRMIRKLVHIIVETGTLTASGAILVLILYFALPQQSYYSVAATVLAKFYSNSLLAVFNSRTHIHDGDSRVGRAQTLGHGNTPIVLAARATDSDPSSDKMFGCINVEREVSISQDDNATPGQMFPMAYLRKERSSA